MYYSLDGDGWTNCSSDRRLDDDDDDDGDNAMDVTSEIGTCLTDNGKAAVRFLDASHECTWFGLSCNNNDLDANSSISDSHADNIHYSPITEISLPRNNLRGTIPMEFYKAFERLSVWNMEGNEVDGTLNNDDDDDDDDGVGSLVELKVLKLNDNKFMDEIPFTALSRLEYLDTINLGGNSLSGNATEMCNAFSADDRQLSSFEADCVSSVICPCCTTCT